MKWIKWFLVLAVGIAMGLASSGCGGDDDGNNDPLVGTWKATLLNGMPLPVNESMTITLKDNGAFSSTTVVSNVTQTQTGTWSAANGVLTTVVTVPKSKNYVVNGDTLTLWTGNNSFTMTRQ